MQYKEGQRLQGSDGNIYVVQGGVPRLAQPKAPSVVIPAPPKEPPAPKTSYRTLSMDEKIGRGLDPAGDYQVSSEGQISSIASPRNQQNQLTATERGKAIQAYTDAAALERVADNLERQYKGGVGKTKGIYGLQDVLPTPGNRKFTDTSHQARGLVKRALGFTGGEGNTIGEIELNYGPYLPEAGNFDERIVSKIEALRNLAKDSRTRSVAMLGGTPDVNGRITPVQLNQQQAASPPPPGGMAQNQTPPRQFRRNELEVIPGTDDDPIPEIVMHQGISPEKEAELKKRIDETDAFGSGMVGAADAMTFGLADEASAGINALGGALSGQGSIGDLYGQNLRTERGYQDALRERDPAPSLAGTIAGSAIGMGGIAKGLASSGRLAPLATRAGGLGGDVMYGAGYGAGSSNDDRLTGALYGAGAAGVGNRVGSGIVNLGGKAVGGLTNPALRALSDRGISLTPGQIAGQGGILGKGYRAIEDTLESIPFLGSAIKARKNEGLTGFNREAFKDALAPINQQVEGTVGQDAVGEAQDLVSGAYGNALGGTMLRADKPFIESSDDIIKRGTRVPVMGEQFSYLMQNKIDPLFNSNLELNGKRFQSALQTLSKARSDFNRQGIMGNEVADRLGDMRTAFTDLAGRQMPDTMPALNAANAANRNVSILGDAVNKQGGDLFTPAQLRRASVTNTKKFGGQRAAARGETPFAGLYNAGEQVLPNVVPNSGTTDRALATLVLPAALGGSAAGAEAMDASPYVSGTLAALAALSTKKGNNAVQKMLLDRPDMMRQLGQIILKAKRPAGMFGAGAAFPLLPGQ